MNADLATLHDNDGTTPSDTLTLNATDSFGNTATQQQIAVTVNGPPVVSVTSPVTVVQGQSTAVAGVSLAESGNTTTSGETFTVTLVDTNGLLSATGTGVSGTGTTSLTITGSLSQVNSDLATLHDTDGTTASDTIAVNATDSFGNAAGQQQITVNVQASLTPVITAPASIKIGQSHSTAISGVSLAETGNSVGETFTVTLSDTNGLLSASGTGRLQRSGTNSLTITGSLAQVNSDLTTLHDTDGTQAADTICAERRRQLRQPCDPAADRRCGERAAGHHGAGQRNRRRRQVRRDLGHQPRRGGRYVTSETFTVTVTDVNGLLSATGPGIVSNSGTTSDHVHGPAQPGEQRSRDADGQRRDDSVRHDHGECDRQPRQQRDAAAGRRRGRRGSGHHGADDLRARSWPCGVDRRASASRRPALPPARPSP